MRILLVEDESGIADAVIAYFTHEGISVDSAASYHSGMDKVFMGEYDCLIADINLPGGSGLEIVRAMKKKSPAVPILILSARDSIENKVEGLNLGADDYLAKPFHMAELFARVKAVIRRNVLGGKEEIEAGTLKLLPFERNAYGGDVLINLTPKEFDLLLFLVSNKGRVLTREAIAEHLWGEHADSADSFEFLYSHIKNLRKKLGEEGAGKYIQTVYGVGYKFQVT